MKKQNRLVNFQGHQRNTARYKTKSNLKKEYFSEVEKDQENNNYL